MRPILVVRFILRFLEAMQGRQRFLEVRATDQVLRGPSVRLALLATDPDTPDWFLSGWLVCRSFRVTDSATPDWVLSGTFLCIAFVTDHRSFLCLHYWPHVVQRECIHHLNKS